VLVPVSAHGSAKDRNSPWRPHAFDDAEQVKGAARQPVDPRYRHHVAEFEVFQHPQKLARVWPGRSLRRRLILI
jgi:hypothetical protein